MTAEAISAAVSNAISPPILFFVLGVVAVAVKSDLTISRELAAALALYLVMAIGFRGGAELAHVGLSGAFISAAVAGLTVGILIPPIAFAILSKVGKLAPPDAAAIAAHYGSISVVTFVTAQGFLSSSDVAWSGFMVAVMALMEAPGVLVGIMLAKLYARRQSSQDSRQSVWGAVREAIVGGSVLLLAGSFVVGYGTGDSGARLLTPFVVDLFPGVLTLFMLDLGIVAARRSKDVIKLGGFLISFGVLMPLAGSGLALIAGLLLGLSLGNTTLLMVLAASASYIAAPAAVRLAIPEASPSISISLALGITFPFNIFLGIPLYFGAADWLIN